VTELKNYSWTDTASERLRERSIASKVICLVPLAALSVHLFFPQLGAGQSSAEIAAIKS
jgi:hypothetical protein